MRLTLKLLLAALVGIALIEALNGYFRVDRELDLFETDLDGDLRGLGRSVSIAMERAWRVGGEDDALIVLEEERAAVAHFDLRWEPHAQLDRALAMEQNGAALHKALERGEAVTYSIAAPPSSSTRDRLVVVA